MRLPDNLAIAALILGLCASSALQADCDDRVNQSLNALEDNVVGDLNAAQRAGAADILYKLCQPSTVSLNRSGDTVYKTVSNEPATNEADSQTDDTQPSRDEEVSLLGMKIRRGDENSKGRERLKKKR